jgi:hypothetical protein
LLCGLEGFAGKYSVAEVSSLFGCGFDTAATSLLEVGLKLLFFE